METYYDLQLGPDHPIPLGAYENCTFRNCNLSEMGLSEYLFEDCTFESCNLSMVKLSGAAFRDVRFHNCKLLGIAFDATSEFGRTFSFDGCQLDHSSFYKMKIRKTTFKNCRLVEVDFGEADLSQCVFEHCDLQLAVFDRSNLEGADFRTAINYSIHPENNKIKKARFSFQGLPGLLNAYQIHIE